jgi:hypothetical protein
MKTPAVPITALATGLLLVGCSEGWWEELWRPRPETSPQVGETRRPPILEETLGDKALIGEGQPMRLRGFGLVIGLGDRGSSDCPSALREYLIEYLQKEVLDVGRERARPAVSAATIIDSLDSAVVEVSGLVPPGAVKGTPFDVQVEAVAGTGTRSLEGGLLVLCDLRQFAPDAAGRGLIEGRTLARARGPVFINPFAAESELEQVETRRGFVPGGGWTVVPRPFKFMLIEPSYPLARRIEGRLNERFGHRPRTAEALSRGVIQVLTPPAWAARPERFIDLAAHLYVRDDPSFLELRLREVSEHLEDPEADLEHVALVWEGIGRQALARVQPLYDHPNPVIRYYAARTGLRLRDATALPVVAQIALTADHPQRLLAIRELRESDFPQAAHRLASLLDSEDFEVRIAAYEALRAHRHPAIITRRFPHALDHSQINLVLDVVRSTGTPLIYVRRTGEPRVAIFGERLPLTLPLFYNHSDDHLVINAGPGEPEVKIIYRRRYGGRLAPPLVIPPRVTDLVCALADAPEKADDEATPGAGLSCSQVVHVLAALCRDGTIPARLELERQPVTELLGPPVQPRRPEGEPPPPRHEERSPPAEPAPQATQPQAQTVQPGESRLPPARAGIRPQAQASQGRQ